MIRAERVIFDNLFDFNFIKIRCNFFGVTLISDGVLSWVTWLNLFMENIDVAACASLPTQFAAVKLPKCLQGLTTPTTDPPTAKNAFKEPPSTAPPSQLA